MIEQIVLEHLAAALEVPVGMEVSAGTDRAAQFVVLEKTSSSRADHLCTAQFAVQSYGPTLLAAMELNEQVKAAMDGLDELDEVVSSRLNSDYNFTDTATKRSRYQAVYDVTHY